MARLDLKRIRELQAAFDAKHASWRRWDTSVSASNVEVLEHLVVCLLGEIGEFANVVKKIMDEDLAYSDALPRLTEEIADSFIYLVKICNQTGIELERAYLDRLAFNEKRFKKFEE